PNDYVANTGMALRLLGKGSHLARLEINFMPMAVAVRQAPKANFMPLIVLGIAAITVTGMYFFTQMTSQETINLQTSVSQKMKLNSDLQKQIKEASDKQKVDVDAYKQTLTTLKGPLDYLAQQRTYLNRDLGKAFAMLPGTMNLTSISDDGIVISLEGTAPSEEMVLDYARDLRQSGQFKLIMVTSIKNQDYNEISFVLTIAVNQ
ncbi:MAG: PilN domain-containing protein, partial [Chloroflexi bacterium]|nr:PilN domain-containing protein [Chloroflexota bacterium]